MQGRDSWGRKRECEAGTRGIGREGEAEIRRVGRESEV